MCRSLCGVQLSLGICGWLVPGPPLYTKIHRCSSPLYKMAKYSGYVVYPWIYPLYPWMWKLWIGRANCIAILTKMIKSSNPWTQDVFPFVWVFYNFFQQCFVVSTYKSFTSLSKFIPRCIILFDSIVNCGIVFLISFSDCSLLMYNNTAGFFF